MKDKLTTNVHSEQVTPPDAKHLSGAVSFYNKMPETNKPLTIIHNKTKEVYEAIRTDCGLWVNGSRVSGCYYSWVYSNCTQTRN